MRVTEYGAEHPETVVLLHGGGLSWWNYRREAELLREDFHVVLPVLDGHAGSDRPFTSIEDNARELVEWIDVHCGGRVALIGGLSLGGQVLLEALSRRGDLCRCALVESAAVIPDRLTHALIAPAFGSSYGLIRQQWFARLQARSLRIGHELFGDYYRDTCRIAKADMIAFLRASTAYALPESLSRCGAAVRVVIGGRERREIKRSAELLAQQVPGCGVTVLPGLHHGEFSLSRPQEYAAAVRRHAAASYDLR